MTGSEVRAWREQQGITQEGAALATGVSLSSWKKYEQGRRTVPAAVSERVTALCPSDQHRALSGRTQPARILAPISEESAPTWTVRRVSHPATL